MGVGEINYANHLQQLPKTLVNKFRQLEEKRKKRNQW